MSSPRTATACVDSFAPLFEESADATLRRYYIEGDVHFTPAGNELIYETVRQAVDGKWRKAGPPSGKSP